jgi:hypothetical protein
VSEPLFKKTTGLVQRHGLAGACAHVVKVIGKNLAARQEERRSAAEEAEFDRRRGVRTSARIEPETLNLREDRAMALQISQVVVADVAEFSFPDGPLVVFLFNPFGPPVLASGLKNLRQADGAKSSEIFVVYHNSEPARLVRDAGFTQVWTGDGDLIFNLS